MQIKFPTCNSNKRVDLYQLHSINLTFNDNDIFEALMATELYKNTRTLMKQALADKNHLI